MADFQKRAKKTRKQAAKRAKKTRKAVGKTSVRSRAQALAAFGVAIGAATAVARMLKSGGGEEQRYSAEPDNLPNTPDRSATTTPAPGGRPPAGADTGTMTETEKARLEQAG